MITITITITIRVRVTIGIGIGIGIGIADIPPIFFKKNGSKGLDDFYILNAETYQTN